MLNYIKKDFRRYLVTEEARSGREILNLLLFNFSFWAITSYRLGRWVRTEFRIPIIRLIFKIITKIFHSIISLLTGIQIPFETSIGPGLYVGHTGFLVVNEDAVIGDNCNIGVGVVIGQAGRKENSGSPQIGNFVYIASGAKVIGKIKVGDYVTIGANAVVTKDVPEKATVAGIPAKIVNYLGSKDFIRT